MSKDRMMGNYGRVLFQSIGPPARLTAETDTTQAQTQALATTVAYLHHTLSENESTYQETLDILSVSSKATALALVKTQVALKWSKEQHGADLTTSQHALAVSRQAEMDLDARLCEAHVTIRANAKALVTAESTVSELTHQVATYVLDTEALKAQLEALTISRASEEELRLDEEPVDEMTDPLVVLASSLSIVNAPVIATKSNTATSAPILTTTLNEVSSIPQDALPGTHPRFKRTSVMNGTASKTSLRDLKRRKYGYGIKHRTFALSSGRVVGARPRSRSRPQEKTTTTTTVTATMAHEESTSSATEGVAKEFSTHATETATGLMKPAPLLDDVTVGTTYVVPVKVSAIEVRETDVSHVVSPVSVSPAHGLNNVVVVDSNADSCEIVAKEMSACETSLPKTCWNCDEIHKPYECQKSSLCRSLQVPPVDKPSVAC